MRILQITFNLSSGGGERFIVDLSNELSSKHEVIIVQIETNRKIQNAHYVPDINDNIRYINLDCDRGSSFDAYWKIYRVIKQVNPDVVHIHFGMLVSMPTIFLLKKPKYFRTFHSMAQRCQGPKWLFPLFKYVYKKRVQAIAISDICKQSFIDLYNHNQVVRINNGRSPITTTGAYEDVKKEITALKQNVDDKILIHVARYHPVKNQKLLLNTIIRLKNEGEHIQLIIVGNGYENTEIEKYYGQPGVHFVGEKRNVGDYLAVSDIFIMSSTIEGLPISLLEAMSLGLIPVSTPAGGVCDVISNGVNGYISSSHSEEEYYHTVLSAIHNVNNISKDHIINDYKSKYSMEACAKAYEKCYLSKFV